MEKGSMLILAIIATLILSLIMVAGLTVTTTEAHTTQNYFLNKVSYYKAVEGVEIVTQRIRDVADPSTILVVGHEYRVTEGGITRRFLTGTMVDMQNGTSKNVRPFTGFDPPPLPSISLGSASGIQPVIWYVPVTSEVTVGNKRSFTEIEAGIYSIIMTGY